MKRVTLLGFAFFLGVLSLLPSKQAKAETKVFDANNQFIGELRLGDTYLIPSLDAQVFIDFTTGEIAQNYFQVFSANNDCTPPFYVNIGAYNQIFNINGQHTTQEDLNNPTLEFMSGSHIYWGGSCQVTDTVVEKAYALKEVTLPFETPIAFPLKFIKEGPGLGDINGDSSIGLEEALYALQVVSNQAPDLSASCILSNKGNWTDGGSYLPCDIVKHEGSYYLSLSEHTADGSNEPTNDIFWTAVGLKGDTGGFTVSEGDATFTSGNVGIGTTNPLVNLHVKGTVNNGDSGGDSVGVAIENDGNANSLLNFALGSNLAQIWSIGGYGSATPDMADKFAITDVSQGGPNTESSRLVIDKSGNVGIGTTSPSEKLHVIGNIKTKGDITLVDEGSDATVAAVAAGDDPSHTKPAFVGVRSRGTLAAPEQVQAGDALSFYGGKGYTGTGYPDLSTAGIRMFATETHTDEQQGSAIALLTTSNGETEKKPRMIINGEGKVGVGTTAPAGEFHVGKQGGLSPITFTGSGLNDISVDISGYTGPTTTHYVVRVENAGPIPNLIGYSSDGGQAWSESVSMSPDTNGFDIGYGVLVGFAALDGHNYGDQWEWHVDKAYPGGLVVQDGNVGINNVAPVEQLDVDGNIAVTGTVDGRDISNDGEKMDKLITYVKYGDVVLGQILSISMDTDGVDGWSNELIGISEEGYLFQHRFPNTGGYTDEELLFESPDCSGQAYIYNYNKLMGVQGYVFGSQFDSNISTKTFYIPQGATLVTGPNKQFNSYGSPQEGRPCYQLTQNKSSYAVFPNDPIVTGLPNHPFTEPFHLAKE